MIVTLALCGTLLASGGLWAPEPPTVGESEFVLSLAELESDSLESARMHRASNRKIVVFIPGLRAKRMVRQFKEGPVRVMRVKRPTRALAWSPSGRGRPSAPTPWRERIANLNYCNRKHVSIL